MEKRMSALVLAGAMAANACAGVAVRGEGRQMDSSASAADQLAWERSDLPQPDSEEVTVCRKVDDPLVGIRAFSQVAVDQLMRNVMLEPSFRGSETFANIPGVDVNVGVAFDGTTPASDPNDFTVCARAALREDLKQALAE